MSEFAKNSLGAKFNNKTNCVDFKVFSKNAIAITLAVFENANDVEPLAQFEMEKIGDVFQTSIKKYALFNLNKPFYWGYYVFGEDTSFKPDILAFDPYALEISYNNSVENYPIKSVFFEPEYIKIEPISMRPFENEVIGEVHLKDLTINADIVEAGTFLGASKMAKTLKNFGITMVEFLPLNEFDNAYNGGNYWGYMPMSYFALNKNYAYSKTPNGTIVEFQKMINEFHKNGIKVCMDVVYNHSAENASFKLIDNKSYYKVDENGKYSDNSCCKNDLNCANIGMQNLIADSIAHFAKLGVDAFRFDLATALLDTNEGYFATYNSETSLAAKLPQMLIDRGIKVCPIGEVVEGINLVAEPWTCAGADAYKIGKFPKKWWFEWNDISRNTIRANSLRPEGCDPFGLKNLIEGFPQIYPEKTRSVNYVACHDGLSLNDVNSYYVEGWEISGDCYGDFEAQENAIKKQIALLMLSNGIPLFGIGDLIAHTKGGNPNTYNIDGEVNYLDFSKINTNGRQKRIFDFWMKLINFRHKFQPQKLQRVYLNEYAQRIENTDMAFWHNKNVNFFAFKGYRGDKAIYIAVSKSSYETKIILPKTAKNKNWCLLCDSANDLAIQKVQNEYTLAPFGLVIFVEA